MHCSHYAFSQPSIDERPSLDQHDGLWPETLFIGLLLVQMEVVRNVYYRITLGGVHP